ncbi:hypothetical protein ABGB12_04610 [Actinocorallia sp. B10E7]|uniref:hypothetical protein n=1 Tax=Actinocorallia sp. B10E7 TaxID=3153558 RepID=UPI00325D43C7
MDEKKKDDDRPESERAAERVSDALERGVSQEELDPADAERTAHATVSPQPEPDERPESR